MVLRRFCLVGCTDPCSEAVRVKDASGHWKTFYVRYKLDTGGFSRIDLIFDKGSKRSFALKRILCHSKDDESKALKEANFQSNLPDHPNLLPCIASGLQHVSRREQGAISEVLLVLSYSKRGTLQREIDHRSARNDMFPLYLIKTMMIGICDGLIALLSLDIPMSHRDIKPGNVLLFEEMRPVLMDFGSVTPSILPIENIRDAEKWKEFAEENCSLTYRAPELFNPITHENITEKADSLGCLLYALIFFKSPMDFVHARGDSVALAACSANIHFPIDSCSNVPPELIKLMEAMLSANPQDRPSLTQIVESFKNVPEEIMYCNNQSAITYSL
ncbi:serine/threonine kinase [Schistosoma mansoni]|uniref:serine/threonine kinase n=1 Tax=Schistosoma mansoni TaxID=6183 RepID=UPI00022DC2D6|nr:serine/threonine kinase [Schistosoma mansoni]|eukprot:XP_018652062.1 serine/threonine kinase [Schistosoma mansoni]